MRHISLARGDPSSRSSPPIRNGHEFRAPDQETVNNSSSYYLKRVHVLSLDPQIAKMYYPKLPIKPNVDLEPTRIYKYFCHLLNEKEYTILSLFQTFYIDEQGYVIVDIDTSDAKDQNTGFGYLTRSTSIYTTGPIVQPLTHLRLALIRPFPTPSTDEGQSSFRMSSGSTAENHATSSTDSPTSSCASQKHDTKKNSTGTICSPKSQPVASRSSVSNTSANSLTSSSSASQTKVPFYQRARLAFLKTGSSFSSRSNCEDKSSSHESNNNTHLSTSCEADQPCNTLPTSSSFSFSVSINLSVFLESAVNVLPSIVFVRGRVLALSFSKNTKLVGCLYKKANHLCNLELCNQEQSIISQDPLQCCQGSNENKQWDISSLSFLKFHVASTGDIPLGIAIPGVTVVSIELDTVGEFSDIFISPIIDTIPVAYEFRFFDDYMKPFLDTFPSKLFYEGDLFSYHGVQFKVQRTIPSRATQVDLPDYPNIYWKSYQGILSDKLKNAHKCAVTKITKMHQSLLDEWNQERQKFKTRISTRREGLLCSRIGQLTRIHQRQPTPLHWVDVLPSSVVQNIRLMPSRLQPFSLMHAIGSLAPSDILRLIGWSAEQLQYQSNLLQQTTDQEVRNKVLLKVVEEFSTTYNAKRTEENTNQNDCKQETEVWNCVVCLEDIVNHEKVLQLPCSHVFHVKCVTEWLKRSVLCPICKRDLRDFL